MADLTTRAEKSCKSCYNPFIPIYKVRINYCEDCQKLGRSAISKVYGNSEKGKITKKRAKKKYCATEKGKIKNSIDCKKFTESIKGIKYLEDYRKTEKYKSLKRKSDKKYSQTTKGKENKYFSETKRRHKKHQLIQNFTFQQWEEKVHQTNGVCPCCTKEVGIDKLTMDHIMPISKAPVGFEYTIEDVQPLCMPCNSTKGAKIMEINS